MDSHDLTSACKDLGHTDATRCLVVANRVYDPAVFSPDLFCFTRKQYIFLNSYKMGVPIEEACQKAEMSVDSADRFLKKESTVKWLEDRALKDHIRNEWQEPGKWWKYGDEVLQGERQLSKGQMVVFQAFGDRIAPKKEPSDTKGKTVINFNFSPESVKEAFRRQASIETEIVQEQHGD